MTLPENVFLDSGEVVSIMPDRAGACPAEITNEFGESWECWREEGHEGLHVQPCFDWCGRLEHRSPLWIW